MCLLCVFWRFCGLILCANYVFFGKSDRKVMFRDCVFFACLEQTLHADRVYFGGYFPTERQFFRLGLGLDSSQGFGTHVQMEVWAGIDT